MNKYGYGRATIYRSSSNKNAIRGSGAKSQNGTSGNAINGISPNNKKYSKYIKAATKEFGKP
ncbi:hypothetical protein [Paenibacillus sp. USHLN196]|uniref:hypothetical protein n=1 Tax=Paenibacillus sp. USHLN196 TaxID=3081291 RepID=UPI00301736FE